MTGHAPLPHTPRRAEVIAYLMRRGFRDTAYPAAFVWRCWTDGS